SGFDLWERALHANDAARYQAELPSLRAGLRARHAPIEHTGSFGSQQRSMMVALAVPRPSQIASKPYLPWRRRNSYASVPISLAPVAPSGWPSACAPPLTFSLSRLAPNALAHASGTEPNASFTSYRSMSSIDRPVCLRIFSVAGIGPSSTMVGSEPTALMAWMRAIGFRPDAFMARSLMISTAAAPSHTWLAVPAVIRPSGSNGCRAEMASSVALSRRPSSRS